MIFNLYISKCRCIVQDRFSPLFGLPQAMSMHCSGSLLSSLWPSTSNVDALFRIASLLSLAFHKQCRCIVQDRFSPLFGLPQAMSMHCSGSLLSSLWPSTSNVDALFRIASLLSLAFHKQCRCIVQDRFSPLFGLPQAMSMHCSGSLLSSLWPSTSNVDALFRIASLLSLAFHKQCPCIVQDRFSPLFGLPQAMSMHCSGSLLSSLWPSTSNVDALFRIASLLSLAFHKQCPCIVQDRFSPLFGLPQAMSMHCSGSLLSSLWPSTSNVHALFRIASLLSLAFHKQCPCIVDSPNNGNKNLLFKATLAKLNRTLFRTVFNF